MNARNQLLVVLTALMIVCSSGAMVVAASPAATSNEHNANASEDHAETPAEEPIEAPAEAQNETLANETDNANETNATDNESPQPAHVTFEDQSTDGNTVVVANVSMASGGFVTIHNSSLLTGDALGSVIGVSEHLEAGAHENVTVTLDKPLEEDETLIAMPHRDTNKNQTYDFVESEGQHDGPYLTANNEAVTDEAVVTVDGGAAANVSEEKPVSGAVAEEPTNETNVTDNESVGEAPAESDEDNASQQAANASKERPCPGGAVAEEPTNETENESVGEQPIIEPADEMNVTDNESAEAEPTNETNVTDNESAEAVPDEDNVSQQAANVTFENQSSNGTAVVVANVSMASGGFVTIHNSSLLDGDALGSVIGVSEHLEAGTHENVTVTLDEPLEEDETLIAMPHRDTNKNQAYDFVESEGQDDGPYLTANNEAVTDKAFVTVDGDTTANVSEEKPFGGAVVEEPTDETNVTDNESVEEEPVTEPTNETNVTDNESVGMEPANETNVTDNESVGMVPANETNVTAKQPIVVVIEQANIFVIIENHTGMPANNTSNDTLENLTAGDGPQKDNMSAAEGQQINAAIEQAPIFVCTAGEPHKGDR